MLRSYLGKIESTRDSDVGFELGGKLIQLHVDEGQTVEKGQLMAELDTRLLRARLEALSAQVRAAEAKLDELIAGPRKEDIAAARAEVELWTAQWQLSRITEDRIKRLLRSRSVSDQEADESEFNEQVVGAQLKLAQANLDELKN